MQSRIESLIEKILDVGSGFIIALLFWTFVVQPVWDIQTNFIENIEITICFTVISIVRGYYWRRYFNAKLRKLLKE